MKIFPVLLFCLCFLSSVAQFRELDNKAFAPGEKLKYRVHYGIIDAGVAEIEIEHEEKKIGSRTVYHAVGKGYTNKTFDFFFKVRDRYETYIDKSAVVPILFVRRVDEGGFKINQNQFFNHHENTVKSDGKTHNVPAHVQDMLSSFYFARTIDYSKADEGQVFTIPTFVDNEMFPLKMRYVGKEVIDADLGRIRCLKFRPIIQKGRVFKNEEDLAVYVSDDANHIPIRAEARILVGSVKMDLSSFENLKNPVAFEK